MDTKVARDMLAGEGYSIDEFIDPLMTSIPGGICLRASDGNVVGAIGTSGRRPPAKDRDQEVAEVGARTFQEMQGKCNELDGVPLNNENGLCGADIVLR